MKKIFKNILIGILLFIGLFFASSIDYWAELIANAMPIWLDIVLLIIGAIFVGKKLLILFDELLAD